MHGSLLDDGVEVTDDDRLGIVRLDRSRSQHVVIFHLRARHHAGAEVGLVARRLTLAPVEALASPGRGGYDELRTLVLLQGDDGVWN